MTILEKFADLLSGARTAIGKLHETDVDLRRQHGEACAEKMRLIGAPGSKKEAVRTLDREIKEQGERWASHCAPRLIASLVGRVAVAPSGAIEGIVRDETVTAVVGLLRQGFYGLGAREEHHDGRLPARAGPDASLAIHP